MLKLVIQGEEKEKYLGDLQAAVAKLREVFSATPGIAGLLDGVSGNYSYFRHNDDFGIKQKLEVNGSDCGFPLHEEVIVLYGEEKRAGSELEQVQFKVDNDYESVCRALGEIDASGKELDIVKKIQEIEKYNWKKNVFDSDAQNLLRRHFYFKALEQGHLFPERQYIIAQEEGGEDRDFVRFSINMQGFDSVRRKTWLNYSVDVEQEKSRFRRVIEGPGRYMFMVGDELYSEVSGSGNANSAIISVLDRLFYRDPDEVYRGLAREGLFPGSAHLFTLGPFYSKDMQNAAKMQKIFEPNPEAFVMFSRMLWTKTEEPDEKKKNDEKEKALGLFARISGGPKRERTDCIANQKQYSIVCSTAIKPELEVFLKDHDDFKLYTV